MQYFLYVKHTLICFEVDLGMALVSHFATETSKPIFEVDSLGLIWICNDIIGGVGSKHKVSWTHFRYNTLLVMYHLYETLGPGWNKLRISDQP